MWLNGLEKRNIQKIIIIIFREWPYFDWGKDTGQESKRRRRMQKIK